MKLKLKEGIIRGISISQGIAIGKLHYFSHRDVTITEKTLKSSEVEHEVKRFERALSLSKKDIVRLKKQFEKDAKDEASAVLDTQLQVLDDPLMSSDIVRQIRDLKKNAEFIFTNNVNDLIRRFEEITDPFFRERGRDLFDISRRVINYLKENKKESLHDAERCTIVYSEEITASDVAEANPKKIAALISNVGGVTSHAAIVAKAKGIPFIANVNPELLKKANATEVIVDGRAGEIHLFPKAETVDRFTFMRAKELAQFSSLEKDCRFETCTKDGHPVRLLANIDMVSEIDLVHRYQGCGIGLFRSEYMCLSKQSFPNEEEQFTTYCQIVNKMKGLPVVIRTFDVGGDKLTVELQATHKGNPYLGCRAIRFLLREKEIFKTQLRAILRASEFGEVSVMFPMISDLSELLESKAIIKEVEEEISIKKRKKSIRIGCMIEVPSAVMIADLLAKNCDFLAIGTNDLVQYLLAVDRCNNAINHLYTPMHPALIRTIKLIVTQAKRYNKPVSVCGEIAGDPRFTPLLLGLGVEALSVALRNMPLINTVVRKVSMVRCLKLADRALQAQDVEEIKTLLDEEYRAFMPERYRLV